MSKNRSNLKPDSILQWNINGLKSNYNELKQLIHQYNPYCVTLNETRSTNQQRILERGFKNYTPYFDLNNPDKGNLILIRKDINFLPVPLSSPLNAIAIEINREGQAIKICSIYFSPNILIRSPDIVNLINHHL